MEIPAQDRNGKQDFRKIAQPCHSGSRTEAIRNLLTTARRSCRLACIFSCMLIERMRCQGRRHTVSAATGSGMRHLSRVNQRIKLFCTQQSQRQCRFFQRELFRVRLAGDFCRLVIAQHRIQRRYQHQ